MAIVAALLANPIFLRNPPPKSPVVNPILLRAPHPKFSAAKLRASCNSRRPSTVSSSCSAPKFAAVEKSKCSSRVLGTRHASLCMPPNAHLGIGKPLGRVGGKLYPKHLLKSSTDPYTSSSRLDPMVTALNSFLIWLLYAYIVVFINPWTIRKKALVLTFSAGLEYFFARMMADASVVNLQLCFSGKGGELGFHLNQIAENADTSTPTGLSYVLNETTVALLRHLDDYKSGSVSVLSTFGTNEANLRFDQLSIDERINNTETLVNVNNVKFHSPKTQNSANDHEYNDDIMVAIFVGVHFWLKLPAIHDKYDLQVLLQKLRSVGTSNCIRAVEVLWTPQISSCLATAM